MRNKTDLFNTLRIRKAPTSINVRLSDFVATITATTFRFYTTIAGTTIAVISLLVQPIKIILELRAV